MFYPLSKFFLLGCSLLSPLPPCGQAGENFAGFKSTSLNEAFVIVNDQSFCLIGVVWLEIMCMRVSQLKPPIFIKQFPNVRQISLVVYREYSWTVTVIVDILIMQY